MRVVDVAKEPDTTKEKVITSIFTRARAEARDSVKGEAFGRIIREQGREGLLEALQR